MPAPPASGPAIAGRLLLALVWAMALWPVALWALHAADPSLAVAVARRTEALLASAALVAGVAAALTLLVLPPARAWLRLVASRSWTSLSLDRAALQRALADLAQFENAARHAEVGRLLRQAGRHTEASHHFARAVELDPAIASAWHQLGLSLFAARAYEPAAHAFAQAERLDPGHAFGEALLHRGRARHELRDPEALTLLRLHQQRHGGGPRSHFWLAEALFAAGEREPALAALRDAAAATGRLGAEENWYRARARFRLRRMGGTP